MLRSPPPLTCREQEDHLFLTVVTENSYHHHVTISNHLQSQNKHASCFLTARSQNTKKSQSSLPSQHTLGRDQIAITTSEEIWTSIPARKARQSCACELASTMPRFSSSRIELKGLCYRTIDYWVSFPERLRRRIVKECIPCHNTTASVSRSTVPAE
ncbi:hypothetical protein D5086_002189 [Populus alba]|uniref:Uncharacterized protein n=1 Tax=Populus alba TaxID=43335 RepID=A0ACC4D290_POPAL